ncbi:hypothetical protein RAS12_24550 [Achromobacter seleniivolatilans]|uniref:SecDF P1 head subdomain domain-containing protein n=1 Tax=Achromobacter seleniivolatilans TaxID=3047478 RepID=A0ABY9M0M6_9BURK|nr:hypothetical protein [Achromobacter sp. R39]WMD19753.1 hypothetical protein RAS12_24550 [Achromobacter sp. R39]
MPSMKRLVCTAAITLMLPLAAYAESITLHAASATASSDAATSARVVDIELQPDSRKALADFTRERIGKRVQLRSNGVLLSSATVMSPLEGDSFRITAGEHGFAGKSAEEIAQGIMKSGGLTIDDENTAK